MKSVVTTSDELDQILHSVANGVTIQDAAGQLLFVNTAAAAMMNIKSPADAVKQGGAAIAHSFNIFDERGRELRLADLPGRKALQGIEEPEKIVQFTFKDQEGTKRWTIIKALPVLDKAGKVSLVVNVLQDITTLKETELRLREANDRITDLLEQALLPAR